jgi:hypothetical protein
MMTKEEAKAYFDRLSHRAGKHGLQIAAEVTGNPPRETGGYIVFRSWEERGKGILTLGPGATLQNIEEWLDVHHPEGGSP